MNHFTCSDIAAIDLEIHPVTNALLAIGASLNGNALRLTATGNEAATKLSPQDPLAQLKELDQFCAKATFLLGHNFILHDRRWLQENAPDLNLLRLPVIDTLVLATLAFPTHPYHKLYKGYKLAPSAMNDPLRDSECALSFFAEERQRLAADPFLPIYRHFLSRSEEFAGCAMALADLTNPAGNSSGSTIPPADEFFHPDGLLREERWRQAFAGKLCEQTVSRLPGLVASADGPSLAMAFAWLAHADEKSRLAPWVVHQFGQAVTFLREVRDINVCGACAFCREYHDPTAALRQYFGFDTFRPISEEPPVTQKEVVEAILGGEDLLVVLSTGGGKSLCYQLPGRMLAKRRNLLTLVISPLQSLMKDQVDSMRARGISDVGAVNGMQTMLERLETIEGISLGQINILFAAPEQMRNENFCRVLQQRELGLLVIDEAHCLSKWGHDFRPDYLYICKFLRNVLGSNQAFPPVACFTATAKKDVITEICTFFRTEAGKELRLIQGGLERPNLHFFVSVIELRDKRQRILEILHTNLGETTEGAGLIFTATRKKAEELAEFLTQSGIPADFFHAGLPAETKHLVQQRFLDNSLRVITATNAFGMGVDKPDIRVVIHADVPGSLENYLQEAGRAGRDRRDAECHLLFCQSDLEDQFSLSSRSRITFADLVGIFRGIKHLAQPRRRPPGRPSSSAAGDAENRDKPRLPPVVKTTGEILRDDEADVETFDRTDDTADTKVKIALSWLEKLQCLERTWNRTSVIQARPRLPNLEESLERMRQLALPGTTRTDWGKLLSFLYQAKDNDLFNTDALSDLLGREGEAIQKTFRDMRSAGLVDCNVLYSALITHLTGTPRDAKVRWDRAKRLELGFRHLLNEIEPGDDNSVNLHIRGITTLLKTQTKTPNAIQEDLGIILHRWQSDGSVTYNPRGFEMMQVRFLRTRRELNEVSQQRLQAADRVLRHLLLQVKSRGADIRVGFSQNEIEPLLADLGLEPGSEKTARSVRNALLTLHETKVITLQNGLTVFRPALTIQLQTQDPPKSKDCEDLAGYFDEKTAQIHVMGKYAQFGQTEIRDAHRLVNDYFQLDRDAFSNRYFRGETWKLEIPTGEESLDRILGQNHGDDPTFALSPEQRAIVQENRPCNIMILAGPGSGKTKTLVHRAAWLIRVKRVPWGSVLIVAFNRSTVLEIRHRLKRLLGRDARRVHVQTYHGLALRIAGRSLAVSPEERRSKDFETVMAGAVREANMILEGLKGRDRDELTGGMLGKLQYVLVDEYQDVNTDQYRMISLLARKDEPEAAHKINLLAVGDDDQNIYTWNGADVRFLRQFTADYQAETHHLLTNYRSTPEIVQRTAAFVAHLPDRMKAASGMVSARAGLLPQQREGVRFLAAPSADAAFPAITAEIRLLLERGFRLHEIAVLSRLNEDMLTLRSLAEEAGFPTTILRKPQISVLRLREIRRFLERLKTAAANEPPPEMVAGLIQEVRGEFTNPDNPWEVLIDSVIEQYFEETAHPLLADCFHFFMDTVREFRQGETRREGFLSLATMHAAKGLEFPAVIVLLDGIQTSPEDTRLAYVAMTRAREALSVVSSAPQKEAAKNLGKREDWLKLPPLAPTAVSPASPGSPASPVSPPSPAAPSSPGSPASPPVSPRRARSVRRQVYEMGPPDVKLSWPASHAGRQIIDTIARIQVGSRGHLIPYQEEFRILYEGVPVVCTSKAGSSRLRKFAGMTPVDVVCYAILTRSRADEQPDFQPYARHDEWEYPLFQITFAPQPHPVMNGAVSRKSHAG
jgi:ATP-dependent DNA helicase RecQ